MDLDNLLEWAIKENDLKNLQIKVKKEGTVNVCSNLLGETKKRILLIKELEKKIVRNRQDIESFLAELRKRGVGYDQIIEEEKPEGKKEEDTNIITGTKPIEGNFKTQESRPSYARDLPKSKT